MERSIRPAVHADAESISCVIVAALRQTNAGDYTPAVIARVEKSFSPDAIRNLVDRRLVFVCVDAGAIVGTASLDGRVVRTVFIAPDHQGRGIGRAMMRAVEEAAFDAGVTVLTVPSSITAEPFYAKLGYVAVRDEHFGDERTIIMERPIAAGPDSRKRPRTYRVQDGLRTCRATP